MSTETTYQTIASYHLTKGGYITKHQVELILTLPGDATAAAQIALGAVRVAAGPSTVTNLQLQVAIASLAESEQNNEL